ncbi:MAG: FG-GAP-like repeat-containing protein, partial [Gemmataceae bacterium]|nr:FG-GAP-like repeat-containing protein [Gemmataceae bacterium]
YSTDGGATWLPGGGAAGTQVTVPATSTGIQVRVSTIQDTTDEPDETFTLGGTAISGSVTAVNSGTGTIIDNDPAPTITIGNGSAVEGNQVVFGVSLSNPSSSAIVLDLTATGVSATAGVDFTANNFEYSTDGGITWLPGGGAVGTQVTVPATSTGIQVRVSTIQDTTDEPDETFTLGGTAISGSVTAVNSGIGTIFDNDPPPTITIGNTSVTEGGLAVFPVTLSNPSSTPIVINLTATGGTATSGTDYTPTNFQYSTDGGVTWLPGGGPNGTQVTVPANSTGIQVRVATVTDTTDEPNETFMLTGSAVSGAVTAINAGTGTIIDDDPAPTVTIGNTSVTEGGLAVFPVTLSNPSSTPIVLNLTATGGTATSVTDYTPTNFQYSTDGGTTWLPGGGPNGTQVTVPANSTGIQVRVATVSDTTDEPNETFMLTGSAVSGSVTAINAGTGTIIDDDPAPTVTIGNTSVTEGGLAVFPVTLSNPSSTPIVINLTATGGTATSGTDYTPTNFEYSTDGGTTWLPGGGPNGTQVTVPANSTGIQVRVATLQDPDDEPAETFQLTGTAVSGAVTSIVAGTGTIIDDDLPAGLFGFVFVDTNANGLRDPGEAGIPNVLITISGTAFAGRPQARPLVAADVPGGQLTILTDANGRWEFLPIPTGTYTITELQPTRYLDGNEQNGDPSPANGIVVGDDMFSNVILSAVPYRGPFNFGELPPSSVGGNVYFDANANGTQEAGEWGIAGVTVRLTGADDRGPIAPRTIITGSSGTFRFTGLRPGSYTITETQPPSYDSGVSSIGTQGGLANGDVFTFVLGAGVSGSANNFAEILGANRLISKEQLLASTPVFGAALATMDPNNLPQSPSFANAVATTKLAPATPPRYVAIGAGAGGGPHVRVFDYGTGVERFSFYAYDASFHGGVRVAVGDVNGDGTSDIVTGPGPGMSPVIKIFSGVDGSLLSQFTAFTAGFAGGVSVATGDITGDGKAEIIVGAGPGGGPHVRVFNGTGGIVTESFAFAASFTGGVNVAAGDVNSDGKADVMVAAGPGGGPHVRVFSAGLTTVIRDFFAYAASFNGGVNLASGDINGDGVADIITAPASNGGPHVRAFSGVDLSSLANLFAYAPSFLGGVNVAARDINGDGRDDIITAPASNYLTYIRLINAATNDDLDAFLGYAPSFRGGAYVG